MKRKKNGKRIRVEIHGFNFHVGFIVIDYANKGESLVIYGRYFLVTIKSKVDFGLREMRIDLTMLEEDRNLDAMLVSLVEEVVEVGSRSGELVKMGNSSQNKSHNVENKKFGKEDKFRLVEHGLPKKMCDPRNFVLPVRVNETVRMSALVDTGASVSVLPYILYKNLRLSELRPYHSNLTMADNTQAKLKKNYFFLLGRPFLRTCDAIIDMGHGRDEDGNLKYGPVVPLLLDIEDEMERALAMEAYFNPFKIYHCFQKDKECQKNEFWMISALEEGRDINVAWIIVEFLCKSAPGIKENSDICRGHYVTMIARSLGYYVDEELDKCSELIECEKWTAKMFAKELDLDNYTLLRSGLLPQPPRLTREQRQEPSGLNSSWGDWNACLNEIERSMPSLRGTSIIPSLGYEVEGSLGAMQEDDDEDDT
nr:hypothetical protein [Tanacetum cinerariifolium]